MNKIIFPIGYYPDPTRGRPLAGGSLYIGIVDTDPEIISNQKDVTALQENGSQVTITQPISLSAGGVSLYNGSPVSLFVSGDYSMKVLNSLDSQDYYIPNNTLIAIDEIRVFATVADMIAASLIVGNTYMTQGYYTAGDGAGTEYLIKTAAQYGKTPDEYGNFTVNTDDVAVLQHEGVVKTKWYGVSESASATVNVGSLSALFVEIESLGGATVLNDIPGTYSLNSVIDFGANIIFKNTEGVVYKREHDGSFFRNALGITSSVGEFDGNGNIQLIGGTLDGNGENYYDAFNFFAIGYADSVLMDNITFLDGVRAHAVDLSACKNVVIKNNKFLGYATEKTSPDGYGTSSDTLGTDRTYVEAVQIDHNTPDSFGFGKTDRTQCIQVIFKDNYTGANPARSDSTFTSWGAGIGSHGGVYDRWPSDIQVYGNTFDECIFAGVRCYKWKDTIISNNIFRDCVRDVHYTSGAVGVEASKDADGVQQDAPQSGENITINGNQFIGATEQSILFPEATNEVNSLYEKTEKINISGNIFELTADATKEAIDIGMCSNVVISANVMKNVYRGVAAGYCDNMSISSNQIDNSGAEAVYINDPAYLSLEDTGLTNTISISNNIIKTCQFWAINVSGGHDSIVVNGNIIIDPDQDNQTRGGITFNSGVNNASAANNIVRYSPTGTTGLYGLQVTDTCSNVFIGFNDLESSSNNEYNLATGRSYSVFDRTDTGNREILALAAIKDTADGAVVSLYGNSDSSTPGYIRINPGSTGGTIIEGLPTSDPTVNGELWNDSGTVKVSAG